MTGLDQLAWGNVPPTKTHRYWAQLILAVLVIVWVCGVFLAEFKVYVAIRQDFLLSNESPERASATMFVSGIPPDMLTEGEIHHLYHAFPGGVRKVWINRNLDVLVGKIQRRDEVLQRLELAETELIKKANRAGRQYSVEMNHSEKEDESQGLSEPNAQSDCLVQNQAASADALNPPPHGHGTTDDEDARENTRFATDLCQMLDITNGIDEISILAGRCGDPLGYRGKDSVATEDAQSKSAKRSSSEHFRSHIGSDNGQPRTFSHKDLRTADEEKDNRYDWWGFWGQPARGSAIPPSTTSHSAQTGARSTVVGKMSAVLLDKKGATIKRIVAFCFQHKETERRSKYPLAYDPLFTDDFAKWRKFVDEENRPTHRVARFPWIPYWLPGLPFVSQKVDSIYWCRREMARLNLEIEMDQDHPERFPLRDSAFIQFNHQIAACMACQAVTHHTPTNLACRRIVASPNDVIWENISIKWWEAWMRKAAVRSVVVGMVLLWMIPVAWTASLSQLASLSIKYHWLHWLTSMPPMLLQAIAGVLPALVVSLLFALVPPILDYLAFIQGAQTGTERTIAVQSYYFAFLLVQVFLVVSISGSAVATLGSTTTVQTIPETLATQLPKAANYFFSYMILHALSASSGTLLQLSTLLLRVLLSKILDSTARQKWARKEAPSGVNWGSVFPVYTNFACITLVYCVVAPIILVFAIITFTLILIANRYYILYVARLQLDTGGLLYPRAINQSFIGLYLMELCLIGLFLLVRDDAGYASCIPHAIIMSAAFILTMLYQILLNRSFGPLILHLPIGNAQIPILVGCERKVGPLRECDNARFFETHCDSTELESRGECGGRASNDGNNYETADSNTQRSTPDQGAAPIDHEFQHYALKARQPTVWIPRDNLGIGQDEISSTKRFSSQYISVSDVGVTLDKKYRVVYDEKKLPTSLKQC